MTTCGPRRTPISRGRVPIERVPYVVDQAIAALAGLRHLILVGAVPPVGFFAYPGKPGRQYPADCQVHVLARPEHEVTRTVLAARLRDAEVEVYGAESG